ncbi:MAG: DUF3795 domain-containing protein [Spirochaetales bacterium]|nr:DUF3795 domain-containing protein [Spirochaetales bacterium]
MKRHNIMAQANQIIARAETAFVGALNRDGSPHVSQRSLIHPENLKELFFSSDREGNLRQRLLGDGRASLSFFDESNNITLMGTCEEITCGETKKARWLDWFSRHYPGGPEGPEFTLFRFTTESLSLWVGGEAYKGGIEEILTPLSYCGLPCDTCEFKEKMNCSGCYEVQGKPFWGTCPVASCAREKGLTHCGQCQGMPCETLRSFSCDEGEHGDNPKGARLEMLRMWD